MAMINLLDEARFKTMSRATTPQTPTIGFLRERAIAAERRARRKHIAVRMLVWLSIVANFGWPIVLFNVLN